jgi:hypothetical protein
LGDEPRFEAGDIAHGVGLDFVDSHVVDDHVVGGKVDEFPRAVVNEGGVLLMRSGLPFWCLGVGESSPVRLRFSTLSGGKENKGVRYRADWYMEWTSKPAGLGGLFEDVLFGFALIRVTKRRDKYRRVIGHVVHKFPVAEGVRPGGEMGGWLQEGNGGVKRVRLG